METLPSSVVAIFRSCYENFDAQWTFIPEKCPYIVK